MKAGPPGSQGRRRRGSVAVVATVCLIPLIGVMAFVLDGGMLVAQRRRAQTVADASAHAAACSLYTNSAANAGLDPQGKAAALAETIALANGYDNDGTTNVVKVNIPPLSGPFLGLPGYAEVIVTYNQQRIFSAIFGSGVLPVTARAVARGTLGPKSGASVILLDPSAAGALTVAGSGHIIATGSIQINSSNAAAANANNAGYAKAPTISMRGNYTTNSSGYFSGTMQTNASGVADPLASYATPTTAGLTTQPSLPGYGFYAMSPGIYNGGVSIGGGMLVTMAPGTYYMKGGGFSVANGATLIGNGVTIYLDNTGGAISFQGGASLTLSPPTSGPYAGIVFFQDRANASAISIANGSNSTVTGTVYAPSAVVSFAGGANSQYGSQFIAKSMNISNNASIQVNTTPSNVARGRALNFVE